MAAAAQNSNLEITRALIEAGAEVQGRTLTGTTALGEAAKSNDNPAVCRLLVEEGARINLADEMMKMTPLMFAALRNSNPDVLHTLLDLGADTSPVDRRGLRAIDYAEQNGNLSGTDVMPRLEPGDAGGSST
jgi:CDK inhibitor PHO81